MNNQKEQIISLEVALDNFSKVMKTVNRYKKAIIEKHNQPKYIIIDAENTNFIELTDDEKIEIIAKRVLHRHINAFKKLANY